MEFQLIIKTFFIQGDYVCWLIIRTLLLCFELCLKLHTFVV